MLRCSTSFGPLRLWRFAFRFLALHRCDDCLCSRLRSAALFRLVRLRCGIGGSPFAATVRRLPQLVFCARDRVGDSRQVLTIVVGVLCLTEIQGEVVDLTGEDGWTHVTIFTERDPDA